MVERAHLSLPTSVDMQPGFAPCHGCSANMLGSTIPATPPGRFRCRAATVEALGAALSRVGGILGMGGAASRDRLLQVVLHQKLGSGSCIPGPPAAGRAAHELGLGSCN